MLFCLLLIFFKMNCFETSFRNIISGSNSFDPDQVRQNVGPDLDPNRCRCFKQMTLVGKELNNVKLRRVIQWITNPVSSYFVF